MKLAAMIGAIVGAIAGSMLWGRYSGSMRGHLRDVAGMFYFFVGGGAVAGGCLGLTFKALGIAFREAFRGTRPR